MPLHIRDYSSYMETKCTLDKNPLFGLCVGDDFLKSSQVKNRLIEVEIGTQLTQLQLSSYISN